MLGYIFEGIDGWPHVLLVVTLFALFFGGMAWLFKKALDQSERRP